MISFKKLERMAIFSEYLCMLVEQNRAIKVVGAMGGGREHMQTNKTKNAKMCNAETWRLKNPHNTQKPKKAM